MNPLEAQQTPERRHYIVVVHGIGEQRFNTTATPVVHRFAEARGGGDGRCSESYNCLVPAYLSAQSVRKGATGHGWSEFTGIPVSPPPAGGANPRFHGVPASTDAGRNFRFMEFHWADILQHHQACYASPAEEWAEALRFRLKYHTPPGWLPDWGLPVIERLARTTLPLQRILMIRNTGLAKLIFDDFLGDVHLYGDYERTRGKVVRRFHLMLDEAIVRDFLEWRWRVRRLNVKNPVYTPPEFTILAHSLGTIMCFDALMYGYATHDIRQSDNPHFAASPSLPFLGYTYEEKTEQQNWEFLARGARIARDRNMISDVGGIPNPLARMLDRLAPSDRSDGVVDPPTCPPLLWRNHVRNFVTLGSPIDKYLVLWWNKYLHMGLRNDKKQYVDPSWQTGVHDWLDAAALADCRRIEHFNLCDQHDPVGHRLDVARNTENYDKVFSAGATTERDVVFQRYNHPGLAHICYWDDSELFKKIVTEIVDGKQTPGAFTEESFVSRRAARAWVVFWTYLFVPLLAVVLSGGLGAGAFLLWGHGHPFYAAASLAVAVGLWVKPRLLDYLSGGGLFSPKPGILLHLWNLMRSWHRTRPVPEGAERKKGETHGAEPDSSV